MVSDADVFDRSEDAMSNRLDVAPAERVPTKPQFSWATDEMRIVAEAQRMRAEYFAALSRRVREYLRRKTAEFGQTIADARAARVLSEMSDRELADIGLTRGDIAAIAAGKAKVLAEDRTLHIECLTRTRAAV
jgi:uncharacterized protein YjiS (DUF1127 family)